MSLIYTIPQYINLGEATVFLMGNYQNQGVLWGERLIKQQNPTLVAIVTDALNYQYQGLPNDSTLEGTAEYLFWLCGLFQLQARNLTGGSSVVPTPPITPMPNNLDFYVDASTTPFVVGQMSQTFPQFIGYNIVFNRDGVPQAQANDGSSNYFSWNKITGQMLLLPSPGAAPVLGELFSINPV